MQPHNYGHENPGGTGTEHAEQLAAYLPKLCSWPTRRAARPDCGQQPVARRPAGGGANDGRGGRGGRGGRAGANAAAATIVVLLRTAVDAAPWTCRPRCTAVVVVNRRW